MEFSKTSPWMKPTDPKEDVVVSSRVRLARNLADLPFPGRLSPQGLEEVLEIVRHSVDDGTLQEKMGPFSFLPMQDLSKENMNLLLEKHLISPRHLALSNGRAVVLSSDETASILVNEEDHLRIQGFVGGQGVSEALQLVMNIDDALEESLSYAYDGHWGFLTSCPTNVGTGMRASVMVHLPALTMTGGIEELNRQLQGSGFALRGYYGEGTRAHGDLYQVSNQRTLGWTEEEIAAGLEVQIQAIVAREREVRGSLFREKPLDVEDQVKRSLGTLVYGIFLSAEEALKILSHLRLGVLGGLDLAYAPDMETFNILTVKIQAGHLRETAGRQMSTRQRDHYRADFLRQALAGRHEEEKKDG